MIQQLAIWLNKTQNSTASWNTWDTVKQEWEAKTEREQESQNIKEYILLTKTSKTYQQILHRQMFLPALSHVWKSLG